MSHSKLPKVIVPTQTVSLQTSDKAPLNVSIRYESDPKCDEKLKTFISDAIKEEFEAFSSKEINDRCLLTGDILERVKTRVYREKGFVLSDIQMVSMGFSTEMMKRITEYLDSQMPEKESIDLSFPARFLFCNNLVPPDFNHPFFTIKP